MTISYSLFDLNEYIRRVLALNLKDALWITAEIAAINRSRGHVYLDLVQKSDAPGAPIVAQAQAVIWAGAYAKMARDMGMQLSAVLQEGVEVKMFVRVDFHERYGLKMVVDTIDPAYTMGKWALQRRETLQRLRDLGLLERNRRLPLPLVVQRIAVLSSENAAGFQDFNMHLAQNPWGYRFDCTLYTVAVQGENAAGDIRAALDRVGRNAKKYDAIVITRGGGARLDLGAFDDFDLCKAIALTPLPVLTGIGHDSDESVADLTAHASLKTPTAAADFIIQRNLMFEQATATAGLAISEIALARLREQDNLLERNAAVLYRYAQSQLSGATVALAGIERLLPTLTRRQTEQARRLLDHAETVCAAMHPEALLRKGYSLVVKDGKAVASVQSLQSGDRVELRFGDGSALSEIC